MKISDKTQRLINKIGIKSEQKGNINFRKLCDHILDSANDIENAMKILIEDAALYKPYYEDDLSVIFINLAIELVKSGKYIPAKRVN